MEVPESSPETPVIKYLSGEASSLVVSLAARVRVVCRVRPLSENESPDETRVILVVNDKTVYVREKNNLSAFTFDSVLSESTTQEDLYESVGKKALIDFFRGLNGTILAYGQTGAGKSYTIMGSVSEPSAKAGLIPRILENIFTHIAASLNEVEYKVGLSMMEVYKEHIFDLLNAQLKIRELSIQEDKVNGIYVRNLSQAFASSAVEMSNILRKGCKNRRTTSRINKTESSRSHFITQIILTQKDMISEGLRRSHLLFVDLAGSEKTYHSDATGSMLEESKNIDLSLPVLRLVINSITDPKINYMPSGDSNVTRILQESFSGNSRTTLIINISQACGSRAETLKTLRFGSRAKKINNPVHINTGLDIDQLMARTIYLEKQNVYLEEELERFRALSEKNASSAQLPLSESPTTGKTRTSHSSINDLRPPHLLLVAGSYLSAFQDELRRKDDKIAELEQEVLNLKMTNLTSLHNEDLKLFELKCALCKLNDKLCDVELVNTNLRKHLQVSERIIKARGVKIDKLRELVSKQQEQVNQESRHFESKLKVLKDKFDAQKMHDNCKLYPEHNSDLYFSTGDVEDQTAELNSMNTFGLQEGSPGSPIMGLNLRIVKPLRSGMETSQQ